MPIDKDLLAASSTLLVLAILAEGECCGHARTHEGQAGLAEQQPQRMTVTRALDDLWGGSGGLLSALGEV